MTSLRDEMDQYRPQAYLGSGDTQAWFNLGAAARTADLGKQQNSSGAGVNTKRSDCFAAGCGMLNQ